MDLVCSLRFNSVKSGVSDLVSMKVEPECEGSGNEQEGQGEHSNAVT
jgi:hypothetical protein